MSRYTPDSWIERNPDDDGRPPMTDAEMCEEGLCDHAGHCDVCEQPTAYALEDGVCRVCEIAWVSKRLLTFPTPKPSELSILPSEEDARRRARNAAKLEERRYDDAKLRERLDSATDRADVLGGITTTEARAALLREITNADLPEAFRTYDGYSPEKVLRFREWCRANRVFYYARPKENFFPSEARELAIAAGCDKLLLEDMS